MVRVAVITRTKDRPLLLDRAILSIHNQTYKDFVHVIINDAGDPVSVDALVEKYQDLIGDRVKIIHNKESHGMEAASNKAIKSVETEFIAIHDDDDTWHPEFLERTVAHLAMTKAEGVVVRTDKVIESIDENTGKVKELKRKQYLSDVKAINLYRQMIDNQMTPITFIYSRKTYNEIGGYDESLPVLGDWDFGIKYLLKYDAEYLDPGFALANYHHRKFVAGSANSNSFGDGTDKHRYWSNKLMNKYLRGELAGGSLGVGYIMSQLRYDQHSKAEMIKRFLPNSIVESLKKRIRS